MLCTYHGRALSTKHKHAGLTSPHVLLTPAQSPAWLPPLPLLLLSANSGTWVEGASHQDGSLGGRHKSPASTSTRAAAAAGAPRRRRQAPRQGTASLRKEARSRGMRRSRGRCNAGGLQELTELGGQVNRVKHSGPFQGCTALHKVMFDVL